MPRTFPSRLLKLPTRPGEWVVLVTVLLGIFVLQQPVAAQTGSVIFVTTTVDKISSTGGCSLKEAIFSANLENNVAIVNYDEMTNAPQIVTTQCVPGSGDDIIVLPAGAVLQLNYPAEDPNNPTGPTATPIITSNITIEAFGATLQWVPVCVIAYRIPCNSRAFAVASSGHLTIRNAHFKGFLRHAGNGLDSGGGGLGAGGAIYVHSGGLVVENSTFDGNGAVGGDGGAQGRGDTGGGGGGGGLGGDGGFGGDVQNDMLGNYSDAGGGGGGSSGDGGDGFYNLDGGGGGGNVYSSFLGFGVPGFDCGGDGGGSIGSGAIGSPGSNAPCPGGGGGGGNTGLVASGDGASGNYGGGGGGGGATGGNGGNGGFGGGGGAGWAGAFGGTTGGTSVFGGGGGAAADGVISGVGHPGVGGMFGGDANARLGGGGGALGGAIFNDSGSVVVNNSTFSGNFVTRGSGGGAGFPGAADNGADAGGAIFSVNGQLTVVDVTISGNQTTGSGGGIVVVQTSPGTPTSFTLDDSIISNNGPNECSIIGPSVVVNGVGNLIQNNDNCVGVVTSDDPQLGPLQNNGGFTPTMAISKTSSALNTADAVTSLPNDQRGQARPELGGYDIGAFELCLMGGPLQQPCPILAGIEQTYPLTILISPPAGGNTTPPAGLNNEPQGSVTVLTATPNPGYAFMDWSGSVTLPASASTTIIMDQAQTVTANFVVCGCAADVSGSVAVTRLGFVLNPVTGRYAQTVTATNNSANTITGPISLVLDSLSATATLFNATGTTDSLELPAGSPYISANVNLAAGQSTTFALQFTDPTHAAITYNTRVLAGPGAR